MITFSVLPRQNCEVRVRIWTIKAALTNTSASLYTELSSSCADNSTKWLHLLYSFLSQNLVKHSAVCFWSHDVPDWKKITVIVLTSTGCKSNKYSKGLTYRFPISSHQYGVLTPFKVNTVFSSMIFSSLSAGKV